MKSIVAEKPMGPRILDREKKRVEFRVFAYDKKGVSLLLKSGEKEQVVTMKQEEPHIYSAVVEGKGLELLYKFRLEEEGDFPDPYSHYQPQGIHELSQVVDHDKYQWQDNHWKGLELEEMIIYEMHVGTFTPKGTFRAAVDRLDYLLDLGINTLELMPVVQTPGKWNWGYDGINFFSVNKNYGTPEDLKFLVDSCHQKGISVLLDVVYNHLGPEGNYLPVYGPYFTDKHDTPWGSAVNFDDEYCNFTRQMVLESVRHWLEEYRFDGLRLDAVNAIKDESPTHILQEIAAAVQDLSQRLGRKKWVIAETDENDVKVINPPQKGGYGIDSQWMDDLHHTIHTILTGEDNGYYMDYGNIEGLAKLYQNYLYTGEYSQFWGRDRGTDAYENPGRQFVVALQTHDQVGNRAQGERLSSLVDFTYAKAAAGLIFLSPYLPLLFMGEEYAEKNPFLFFTNFEETQLKEAVSQGRRKEFEKFGWDDIPDPEDDHTFYRSRLTPPEKWSQENQWMFNFYRDLIMLRKTNPLLNTLDKKNLRVSIQKETRVVEILRQGGEKKLVGLFNLGKNDTYHHHTGKVLLSSEWKLYGGSQAEGEESSRLLKGSMVILEL